MAVNFVNENIEELLKHALRLEKLGMTKAANQLCIKCLKTAALADDNEDMLAFFYGEGIYKTVSSVRNTVDALLVARCAVELYDELRALNPAASSNPATSWALKNEATSDNRFVDFFSWLTRSRGEILTSDKDRIEQMIYAVRKVLPLKMDHAVAAMYPTAVIKEAVAGRLTVMERGLVRR